MPCLPLSACGRLLLCWRWAASLSSTIFFSKPVISVPDCWQNIFSIPTNKAFWHLRSGLICLGHFFGLFIGASLLAPLADKLGRRLTFMFALARYGAFSLLMAFQNSAEGVILCRFLVGIGWELNW
ncbi:hypothetical protein DMH27_04420 [Raoultella planticola]|nr:hypothetical protein [Raoultella planticola]